MTVTVSSDLRVEIVVRAARQQAARFSIDPADADVDKAAVIAAIDQDNTRWLACLIAMQGWPGLRLVGPDGAHAAFMLARRAPAPYRACWLRKAQDAARSGDVAARNVDQMAAELAVEQGR